MLNKKKEEKKSCTEKSCKNSSEQYFFFLILPVTKVRRYKKQPKWNTQMTLLPLPYSSSLLLPGLGGIPALAVAVGRCRCVPMAQPSGTIPGREHRQSRCWTRGLSLCPELALKEGHEETDHVPHIHTWDRAYHPLQSAIYSEIRTSEQLWSLYFT